MKNRILSVLLLVCILTVLSGCGGEVPAPTTVPTEAPTVPTTAAAEEPTFSTGLYELPAIRATGREASMTMTFYPEGVATEVPAALFIGRGYSIYIPENEGWIYEADGPTDRWTFELLPSTQLAITFYPGLDTRETRDLLLSQEADFEMLAEEDQAFHGRTADTCLDVRLHPMARGTYAVTNRCIIEAAEGSGMRMDAMASTFALNWQEVYLHLIYNWQDYVIDPQPASDGYPRWTSGGRMYLGLYDFEGDGIPELIIGDGFAVSVFTVVEGQAVKLADLYNPHSAVWCNNGLWFQDGRMCAEMAGSDGCDYVGFGYLDGEYKLAYHNELTDIAPTINGQSATREEIDRIYPIEYDQRDPSTLCVPLNMRQDGDVWVLTLPDGTEVRVDEGFDFDLIKW